jgi:GAF domain-containing protein
MMNSLYRFFHVGGYETRTERERAQLTLAITLVLAVLYTLYALLVPTNVSGRPLFSNFSRGEFFSPVTIYGFYLTLVFTLVALRVRRLRWAVYGPALMWFFGAVLDNSLLSLWQGSLDGVELVGLVLVAALLASEVGLRLSFLLGAVTMLLGFAQRTTVPSGQSLAQLATLSLVVFGMTVVIALFLRSQRVFREEGAEVAGKESRLAQITTEIAGRISHRMNLNSVLNTTVELINERYESIYHVQVFLLDDTRRAAKLVASTGAVGKLLIERGHNLPVGSLSVIGQVVLRGEPIVARSNASQTVHRKNEFLPDTRAEAAFPLRLGDTIIGALDLQSKQNDAFEASDLPIFQSLADNIAIAIDNARLVQQTEDRLRENQRLMDETIRTAAEVELLNRQLTRTSWTEFASEKKQLLGLNLDFGAEDKQLENSWTQTLQQAAQSNLPIQEQHGSERLVAVPLRVRGQVIGAMEFEMDADGKFGPEELLLLEEVGEQLGMAAENSRLFETTQRYAQREALVNEIATRMQSANSVDMTLNEAARSLQQYLGANRVSIRLGAPPVDASKEASNA